MRVLLLSLLTLVAATTAPAQETPEAYLGDRVPYAAFDRLPATRTVVPSGEIVVGIASGPLDLPRARLLDWIERCAIVVVTYYGRFPARHTRLLVVPRAGRGVSGGRAWGHRGTAVRITIGEHATNAELARDWVLVPELTHLAYPWRRTYWGGALFARLADVEIRRQTQNRLGLQDALRANLDALWGALGVQPEGGTVRFDDAAPLADRGRRP